MIRKDNGSLTRKFAHAHASKQHGQRKRLKDPAVLPKPEDLLSSLRADPSLLLTADAEAIG